MSDTLTSDELDVEFALWEAEDPLDRPCEARRFDCPNVALYRLLWRPFYDFEPAWSPCMCGNQDLCLSCKDWVTDQPFTGVTPYRCRHCDGVATLKGIEPIRGKA